MFKDTLLIIFAQLIFVASGYAVHIGVGRILGPERYGEFGVIMSLLAVLEIFLVRGIQDTVTKYGSEFPHRSRAIKRQGLKIETILAGILALLVISTARPIALAFHNINLTRPLQISAFVIPLFAIYSVFIGDLSGKRMFGKRAVSMSVQSLGKVAGVYFFILLGFGLQGAISGYVLASVLALLTAFYFSKDERAESGTFPRSKLISFAVPIIIFSGTLSLLMNLDMLSVKTLIRESQAAGFYASAFALTRAPYLIFSAFAITLLPLISQSTSSNQFAEASRYISQSLRFLLLLLAPVAFFTCGSSGPIIRLVYSSRYLPASRPLAILIFGITFLSLFSVLATAITASGKPKISMAIALGLVPLDFLLIALLVPRLGLTGAATATTITCFVGLIVSAVWVKKKFGSLMNGSSFMRISLSSTVLFFIPRLWMVTGWKLIPYALALFGFYLLLLALLKEITRDDLDLARNFWTGLSAK